VTEPYLHNECVHSCSGHVPNDLLQLSQFLVKYLQVIMRGARHESEVSQELSHQEQVRNSLEQVRRNDVLRLRLIKLPVWVMFGEDTPCF
jgi:hypothetical protein